VFICALGLCVLVCFSLSPLSVLASLEISMEVQASTVADAAIIALLLVCFSVLAIAGRGIMHKTKDELEQSTTWPRGGRSTANTRTALPCSSPSMWWCRSRWASSSAVYRATRRSSLSSWASKRVRVHHADQMVLCITYVLGLLQILNFGLMFAFNSNTMSATARTRVVHAYIGINSIVILVWFVLRVGAVGEPLHGDGRQRQPSRAVEQRYYAVDRR